MNEAYKTALNSIISRLTVGGKHGIGHPRDITAVVTTLFAITKGAGPHPHHDSVEEYLAKKLGKRTAHDVTTIYRTARIAAAD